jgi:15-cis-phytoene desaturase
MRVAVFGGGIAGLTAAHELSDRGLEVAVYEPTSPLEAMGPWTAIGGKARSQYFRLTETGDTYLPGEHGFRFLPTFYRNVFDILDRIPLPPAFGAHSRGTVFDRLKPARNWGAAYSDGRILSLPRRRPRGIREILDIARFLLGPRFTAADLSILCKGLARALTMMLRDDEKQLDSLSFWELMDGARLSARAQQFLRTMPRALVAMDPDRGSARTLLFTIWRLIADQGRDAPGDFVFTGPTSEAWFQPWFEHLASRGVSFFLGPDCAVRKLHVKDESMVDVELTGGRSVIADHYVLAVPVRPAKQLLDGTFRPHSLSRLNVSQMEGWMVGAQAILRNEARFDGHLVFPDSPWGVSAIAQHEYWSPSAAHFQRVYGGGKASGLISLIFSAGDRPGLLGHCALGSAVDVVFAELGEALAQTGSIDDRRWFRPGDIMGWHIDDDVLLCDARKNVLGQRHPLMVHPPGIYSARPDAVSGISGLSLAGEYLRTSVDLATMEGATESGKMAARQALQALGHSTPHVELFQHSSPRDGLVDFLGQRTTHLTPGPRRRPAGVLTRPDRAASSSAAGDAAIVTYSAA